MNAELVNTFILNVNINDSHFLSLFIVKERMAVVVSILTPIAWVRGTVRFDLSLRQAILPLA